MCVCGIVWYIYVQCVHVWGVVHPYVVCGGWKRTLGVFLQFSLFALFELAWLAREFQRAAGIWYSGMGTAGYAQLCSGVLDIPTHTLICV